MSKSTTTSHELFPKGFFKQFKSKDDFSGFFNSLFKKGIEEMLQIEMEEHLGYSKHQTECYNTGNSRNGTYPKTIRTENVGDVLLKIPRDRNADFEPKIIPKGETISAKIEDAILGMYSRGMSASDICNQVGEIYGFSISETTISNRKDITDSKNMAGKGLGRRLLCSMDGRHSNQNQRRWQNSQ